MEFVTTIRGGQALIHEGYKYVLNRQGHDDRIFWRCAKSRCCSGALNTINDEIVSSTASEHNHPPNDAGMIACKAVESMKQAAFVPLRFVRLAWQGIKMTAQTYQTLMTLPLISKKLGWLGISLLFFGTCTTWTPAVLGQTIMLKVGTTN